MSRVTWILLLAVASACAANGLVAGTPWTSRMVLHHGFVATGLAAWALMAEILVVAWRPAWLERVFGQPLERLMAEHRRIGWALVLVVASHVLWPFASAWIPAVPVPAMDGVYDVSTPLKFVWIWSHPLCALLGILVAAWGLWLVWNDFRRHTGRRAWDAWEGRHRLWALAFLLLAPHSLRLMKEEDLFSPVGAVNLAMTAFGCWAAAAVLLRRPGGALRKPATVVAAECSGCGVRLRLRVAGAASFAPGHCAYLSLPGDREDPHPFAVAECDAGDGTLGFWIRRAGAWTERAARLREGDRIAVEGPWGDFAPPVGENASWVAAGFGIAAFAARLRVRDADLTGVTLHWCVRRRADAFRFSEVQEDCLRAGVTLRLHESGSDHRHAAPSELLAGADAVAVCGSRDFVLGLRRAWGGKGPFCGAAF